MDFQTIEGVCRIIRPHSQQASRVSSVFSIALKRRSVSPTSADISRVRSLRSDWWRTRPVAFELLGLKWFQVFSESLFYFSQRLENGREARLQFRIFVRKGCIITLAVQHCGYPSAALANLPSSNGTNHTRGALRDRLALLLIALAAAAWRCLPRCATAHPGSVTDG